MDVPGSLAECCQWMICVCGGWGPPESRNFTLIIYSNPSSDSQRSLHGLGPFLIECLMMPFCDSFRDVVHPRACVLVCSCLALVSKTRYSLCYRWNGISLSILVKGEHISRRNQSSTQSKSHRDTTRQDLLLEVFFMHGVGNKSVSLPSVETLCRHHYGTHDSWLNLKLQLCHKVFKNN